MENQIQNKSWIKRHPVITTILVIFVFALIGMNTDKNASQTADKDVASDAETTKQATNKIGDKVQLGDAVVVVNKVSYSQGGQFSKPSSGNTWVNLNITIENLDDSQKFITTLGQMFVRDSEGNSYQVSVTDKSIENINERLDGTIIAKSKRTGWVGFEIPKTATGLQFQYNESMWGKDVVVINLDK